MLTGSDSLLKEELCPIRQGKQRKVFGFMGVSSENFQFFKK
jgi:hypothetical protein